MGTISSGVGLASGLNITEIVDALIDAQSGTVRRLTERVTDLKSTQTGLSALSATLLAINTSATKLGEKSLFDKRAVSVSDTQQISVTTTGNGVAPLGSYQVQALRKASTQQVLSRGYANNDQVIGTGTITISRGGQLSSETKLDLFNGGAGVQRGSFRITDRSGQSAVIDIGDTLNVDDVLTAINNNGTVAVRAEAHGDGIVLTDLTGQTLNNLSVVDINGGRSAADLGINQSVAASTLTGTDVLEVTGDFGLSLINDGNAPHFSPGLADIQISLTDNPTTTFDVTLDSATTLQDVARLINEHEDNAGKVEASIVNGRFVLTDLTGGGGPGALAVTDLNDSHVVRALGLDATAAGDTLTGNRLRAGVNSVLLRNLNGGQGIDELGSITLTDRTGTTATLDLSGAETLDDVLTAINEAESAGFVKLQITATLNAAGNGIVITDTSGDTASNLIIADEPGSTLAAQLGIEIDAADTSVASGSLNLQHVGYGTTLAAYSKNGTVDAQSFTITDSNGGTSVIALTSNVKTVGDLINRINQISGANVTASLNETGDGILLTDEAGGAGTLQVQEFGGKTASDLRLLGEATLGGDGKLRITGRTSTVVEVESDDTLQTLTDKINAAGGDVTAAILNDGSSVVPKRLSLLSKTSGASGGVIIDDGGLGLALSTFSKAQDALIRVGDSSQSSFLLTSKTNRFENAISGLSIEVKNAGISAASIDVASDTEAIASTLDSFVSNYNNLLGTLQDLTTFNIASNERGVLQGNGVVLRVQQRFESLINQVKGTADSTVRSLVDVGIRVTTGGNLTFDSQRFAQIASTEPSAVKDFFVKLETGFADQLEKAIDSYTDSIDGSLTLQSNTAQISIDSLNTRIEDLNEILEVKRTRLLLQFTRMEEAISSLSSQQSAINSLASLTSSASSSSKE